MSFVEEILLTILLYEMRHYHGEAWFLWHSLPRISVRHLIVYHLAVTVFCPYSFDQSFTSEENGAHTFFIVRLLYTIVGPLQRPYFTFLTCGTSSFHHQIGLEIRLYPWSLSNFRVRLEIQARSALVLC